MNKTRLLILCGGRSAEHEISLISGWNLCMKINEVDSFVLTLITIDKAGNWYLQNIQNFLNQAPNPSKIHYGTDKNPILVRLGNSKQKLFNIKENAYLPEIDVVFPLLHGPNGEDGSLQGLLKHLQIPYIGPGVLSSAICMDKDIAKRLMKQAGIPTSDFVTIYKHQNSDFDAIVEELSLPLFVKPANMGSSVGINKVRNKQEFDAALAEAFIYDDKVIIEQFVEGIEVECAVLGNDDLVVSRPGTYVYTDDFFEYETKYLKPSVMQIPAEALTLKQQQVVMELSKEVYRVLGCKGLARVDSFFTTERKFLVNEVNTLPGFTQNSMYPILMEDGGTTYADLVMKLCDLASF